MLNGSRRIAPPLAPMPLHGPETARAEDRSGPQANGEGRPRRHTMAADPASGRIDASKALAVTDT